MSKKTKFLVHGGVLAALYVVLTYAQNLLWPGSTTMAIQMRLSEALCIFAFFTPPCPDSPWVACCITSAGHKHYPWTGWWAAWPLCLLPLPCGG